ncbi:MAG: sugar phosphate isomerase/epimerase family protein [Planctomycetota bacterium]
MSPRPAGPYPNLCPQTIGVNGLTPEALLDLAANSGFEGVDLPIDGVRDLDHAARLRDAARERGLRWGLFALPCDFPTADDNDYANGLSWLREKLPLVQTAGSTRTYNHVWPGSDARPYDAQFEYTAERLRPVAALLEEHGVRYGLEFIGPKHLRDDHRYPFIHRAEQMAQLVQAVGHASGLVIDFFHWYTSGDKAESLRVAINAVGGGRGVVNVHANDAPAGLAPDQQHDGRREMPLATGVIDAADAFRTLIETGYEGPVICEPFQPSLKRLGAMPPPLAAAEALRVLRLLLPKARASGGGSATC